MLFIRRLFLLLSLLIIGYIVYLKWPTDNDNSLLLKFKKDDLTLTAKEYYKRSGRYLKISGKFAHNDTLFEYVFYSQPFSMGPLKKMRPVRKITTGPTRVKNENYFVLISSEDSLFNTNNSTTLGFSDNYIIKSFDSALRIKKQIYATYQKTYQNVLAYKKSLFSETDNGFFLEASDR
ncbi:MAG: hypothetical protein WBP16_15055 [Ferruginibacter sp.]